eukprot:TRINITY_DN3281_c0_g2_i1.p2 TRINITY_DN3281_c0_g2~~TRINITY_DN3281_c0_g2_i1.p2  ORF type:complete len:409 (+),score=81.54 TRINITY_DN3281_c0_g2_i1:2841-4067(+)
MLLSLVKKGIKYKQKKYQKRTTPCLQGKKNTMLISKNEQEKNAKCKYIGEKEIRTAGEKSATIFVKSKKKMERMKKKRKRNHQVVRKSDWIEIFFYQMSDEKVHKCIIIGSGPAGCTAALYAARAGMKPILITGYDKGGQLNLTSEVDNWPTAFETITGSDLVTDIEKNAKRFGAEFVMNQVKEVDFSSRPFKLVTDSETYLAHTVIICTGASARWLGLESEQKFRNLGVSACATCDGFFYQGQEVVIVGGGNTAVEEAIYLSNICSKVTLIHRRDKLRGEKIMHERLFACENVEFAWNSGLDEVLGDDNGVTGVRIKSTVDGSTREIPCMGCFIAIGHSPNTAIFEGQLEMKGGYIVTSAPSTATSVDGVYAAGDVMDYTYRQAITSAGTGCKAALDAQKYLEAHSL